MGGDAKTTAERYLLPLAFGLAPAIMLIIGWPDTTNPVTLFAKLHALPVIAAEIAIIVAAQFHRVRPKLPLAALIALLVLIAIAWLSASLSLAPTRSLFWTGIWMIHLMFGFAVAQLLDATTATRGLMIGFVVFVLLLAARALSAPVADWNSNPPGFDQIRRFGYYGAAVAGLAVGTFAAPTRFTFVVAVTAFALAFWTGARGAVAAVFVAFAGGLVLLPALRSWRAIRLTLAAALLGLSIAIALPLPPETRGADRFFSGGDSGRMEAWSVIAEAVSRRPWLGWGEAQTGLFIPFYHPHNIFLQVLLAWGIIGALFVVILASFAAQRAIPSVQQNPALLPPAMAAATLVAYSVIDGTLYHVHPVAIFCLCIGLILADASVAKVRFAPVGR